MRSSTSSSAAQADARAPAAAPHMARRKYSIRSKRRIGDGLRHSSTWREDPCVRKGSMQVRQAADVVFVRVGDRDLVDAVAHQASAPTGRLYKADRCR